MKNFFDSTKKLGPAVVCGALVMSLCTGAALAASKYGPLSNLNENGTVSHTPGTDSTTGVTIRIKDENDNDNLTTEDQLQAKFKSGLLVRNMDGKLTFSTDEGNTWSETAPDGVTVNEDGTISGYGDLPELPTPTSGSETTTAQKGVLNIQSVDDVPIPKDSTPRANIKMKDENGKVTDITGDRLQTKLKSGLIVKNMEGKLMFSTDSGKTWSESTPDGITVNEDGSISGSIEGLALPSVPQALPSPPENGFSQSNITS